MRQLSSYLDPTPQPPIGKVLLLPVRRHESGEKLGLSPPFVLGGEGAPPPPSSSPVNPFCPFWRFSPAPSPACGGGLFPSLLSPSPASRRRKRVPFCSGSSQVLFFPSSPVSPAREPLLEASAADSTHGVSSLDDVCWLSSVWFRLYLQQARSPHPLPVICCNLSLFDLTLASSPRDRLDCCGFAYPCRASADVRRRLPQAALCAVRWLQRFPFIGAFVLLPRLVLLLCFCWRPLELPSMWSSSFVLVGWGFAPLCEGLRSSGCSVGWFPFVGVRRFLPVEGNLMYHCSSMV
ncbi:hypothetical protein Taro_051199 [Colocasia esculenta]|uniref:Uncharacterized protein n=1 Tax=Colocasia esculenta TaxID=4460 RepID=A0A843XG49_COLES|nr:hypothetical protein [Colocasia esculenta]